MTTAADLRELAASCDQFSNRLNKCVESTIILIRDAAKNGLYEYTAYIGVDDMKFPSFRSRFLEEIQKVYPDLTVDEDIYLMGLKITFSWKIERHFYDSRYNTISPKRARHNYA